MKFAKQTLLEILWEETEEYEIVSDEITETSRWSIFHYLIFKDTKGNFFGVNYSEGATEMQDESPFEYDGDEIEVDELREAIVVNHEYVGKKCKPQNEVLIDAVYSESPNVIYVAIRKDNGTVMVGQKGQAAYSDKKTLVRSIGYAYRFEAQKKGCKPTDLYSVHQIDVSMLLPSRDSQ